MNNVKFTWDKYKVIISSINLNNESNPTYYSTKDTSLYIYKDVSFVDNS